MSKESVDYESDESFYSRPENKLYSFVDEDGFIYAEVRLPTAWTEEKAEHRLGLIAQATGTQWTER